MVHEEAHVLGHGQNEAVAAEVGLAAGEVLVVAIRNQYCKQH